MFSYSVMGLLLLWRQSPGLGVNLLVATLVPIVSWGSFLLASFLPDTGEEQMPHVVGIPLNLFIAGLLVLVTVLGYGLYRRGLQKQT